MVILIPTPHSMITLESRAKGAIVPARSSKLLSENLAHSCFEYEV